MAWQTRPIPGTGSLLASSADGLAWIHQDGEGISTLEVVTTDGLPPLSVQVTIADLLAEVG